MGAVWRGVKRLPDRGGKIDGRKAGMNDIYRVN